MAIQNKCFECEKRFFASSDPSVLLNEQVSIQYFGGQWAVVCIDCARKLKANGSLGAAMDDITF